MFDFNVKYHTVWRIRTEMIHFEVCNYLIN